MVSGNPDARHLVFHGHISASPELVARVFLGTFSTHCDESADAAIFVINPAAGIDNTTIDLWHQYSDLQTPRLVVVTTLPGTEMDFDDAILLANRVFDPLVTPYLVLHGLDGAPIGLIELSTLRTTDFSQTPPVVDNADSELAELVAEFREEYFAQIEEMEEGAFAAGILFPAIPINIDNGLGISIIESYLAELPSSS